jgi:hypothetical protein
MVEAAWGGGDSPPPPEPLAREQFSGGYFPHQRRRSSEELERDRERFGIPAEAASVIEAVAQRQAAHLQADEQKRLEELARELALQKIEWRTAYLTELNDRRERLIGEEIGRLLTAQQDEQAVLMMVALLA